MKHTKVKIEFIGDMPMLMNAELVKASSFLQDMLNSTMFEDFVLEGDNTNNENEMNLTNAQIYDFIKEHTWELKMKFRPSEFLGNRPMSHYKGTINVRDWILDYPTSKNAAILAHEYLHHLGFMHKTANGSSFASFSSYVQFKGEKLFRKYEGNIPDRYGKRKLIERKRNFPLCWLNKLEWK